MGTKDKRIDDYIARSADFARPVLKRIREIVREACPEAVETLKWGFPHFMYRGKILCSMASFKAHCTFGFWHPSLREVLAPNGMSEEAMGQFGRMTRLSDLPAAAAIARLVKEAMKLTDAVKPASPRAKRKPARELPVPDDFLRGLKRRKEALKNFQSMPPSHRNEYVEWIAEARTEKTRDRRMATAFDRLAEGRSRSGKNASAS